MTRGKPSITDPYARDGQRRVYVTPAYFELVHGRSFETVRKWARNQKVRSMWHNDTFYVHLQDCLKLDAETPKQERSKQETA